MKRIKNIEDLTYTQLKELAVTFYLKDYTKQNSQKKLLAYIKENVSENDLRIHLNPSWWKRNFNNIGVWTTLIVGLFTVISYYYSQHYDNGNSIPLKPASIDDVPIFIQNDSSHFNVLILRFEDYIANKNTYCIGRSIQEYLNVVQANDTLRLPLEVQYADTILPPTDVAQALRIQKKHHADLIIYGLARNVQKDCQGAEVCFRYNISDSIVEKVAPVINVKSSQHRLDFRETSPMAIEHGELKIDALSLKYWITALVNIKAGKEEEAYLELDKIGNDFKLSNNERAKRYNSIGVTYFSLKQHLKAKKAFEKSIELNPQRANTYYNLGQSNKNLLQCHVAIVNYTKAIELGSNFTNVFMSRGLAYRELEKYKLAIDDFDKTISLDSSLIDAYVMRGHTYHTLKNYKRALKDYNKIIELKDDDAQAFYIRGLTYMLMKQYQVAIADFDKAIEFDSCALKNYYARGMSFSQLGELHKAIEDFNRLIELDTTYFEAYEMRGNVYLLMHRPIPALEDYKKVNELNPDYTGISEMKEFAQTLLVKYIKTLADYSKNIELNPNDVVALNNRCNTLRKMGDYAFAKKTIQSLLSLNSENGWAYAILAMVNAEEGNIELFYQNLEIAISKSLAYPLKKQLEKEESLQRFKDEKRFKEILKRSKD